MGTDRFLGFLDWFMGKQKYKKVNPKYLITFRVIESTNGNWETHTVITRCSIETFCDVMHSQNHKFNITFIIKL